jgi:hypothetical protein
MPPKDVQARPWGLQVTDDLTARREHAYGEVHNLMTDNATRQGAPRSKSTGGPTFHIQGHSCPLGTNQVKLSNKKGPRSVN